MFEFVYLFIFIVFLFIVVLCFYDFYLFTFLILNYSGHGLVKCAFLIKVMLVTNMSCLFLSVSLPLQLEKPI